MSASVQPAHARQFGDRCQPKKHLTCCTLPLASVMTQWRVLSCTVCLLSFVNFILRRQGCMRNLFKKHHVWQELAVQLSVGADTQGVLLPPRTCTPKDTARARVGTEHAGMRSVSPP